MPQHDDRPWGQISEVRAAEIPPKTSGRGKHWNLYLELTLRLEQTKNGKALAIPFETRRQAGGCHSALRRYFNSRRGEGFVKLTTAYDHNGTPTLYIRRGPNWSK